MMRFRHLLAAGGLALLLASCEKEEKPVKLPPPGPSRVATVNMTTDYSQQAFFNLADGHSTYAPAYTWDLAFSCVAGNYTILTNAGKGVVVYATHVTGFDSVQSLAGAVWDWDRPQGSDDSLAIGAHWQQQGQSLHEVYLLDLSSSIAAADRYKKICITGVTPDSYHIRYANPNGSDSGSAVVSRVAGVNYVYFRFANGGAVESYEPPRELWQLQFTRYKTWVFGLGQYIPYIVTGVLLNSEGVQATRVEGIPFEHITYAYAQTLTLSANRDVVGYDWKGFNFDFTNAGYQIQQSWTYVVRDSKGVYYKFRFLDFYNEDHVKGYPKVEYQRL